MKITQFTTEAIRKHAVSEFPREACGVIVNGEYLACRNASPEPTLTFEINAEDWLNATFKGKIEAIIHSHPHDQMPRRHKAEWPSLLDMQEYVKSKKPWGIIGVDKEGGTTDILWLDDNDRDPLEGRLFSHGKNDCYGLCRDYYWMQHELFLNEYPRDFDWWHKKEDLYSQNFEREGFYEITEQELKAGDAILFKYQSSVINHAAVYVGNGNILHHRMGRTALSCVEPLQNLAHCIAKFVRHKTLNQGD